MSQCVDSHDDDQFFKNVVVRLQVKGIYVTVFRVMNMLQSFELVFYYKEILHTTETEEALVRSSWV